MESLFHKVKRLGIRLGFMKAIGYEAEFTCAFRKREEGDLFSGIGKRFHIYGNVKDYWYADPLIFSKNGREYVFMEAVERKSGLGRIAVSQIRDEKMTSPKVIISEDFHMSFPLIFEHGDQIYMIPETSMAQKVILYRCKTFPYEWERIAEFFDGKMIVDMVPIQRKGDQITFLGSECEEDSKRVKFWAFSLEFGDRITAGEYSEYNRDTGYDLISRNAGRVADGKLILQKSTPAVYGQDVLLAEYSGELPKNIRICKEVTIKDIPRYKSGLRHFIGVHTYSCSDRYEVIDVQYLRFDRKKWRKRMDRQRQG